MTQAAGTARRSLALLLPAAGVLNVLTAGAADTPRELHVLQEIVVTATKRSERLQDVPISISAITSDDIEARGFTQYADYLNSVPGVFFQDAGPGSSQIRIRGISAAEGGVPSTTATYFGETVTSVLTNFGGKPNLRLVDIDRVEVLRGPQGTVFGASALAGVVRIIPKAPDLERYTADVGVRGFTTAHSDDASYHAQAAVNMPLIQDRLALRVVAYQDDIAGYIDNIVPEQPAVDYSSALGLPEGTLVTPQIGAFTRRDVNSEDTRGVRAALTWQATDRMKVELMHATQEVTLESEPHTMPAAGDYAQVRALDVYAQGGVGERLEVNTAVISYDWDNIGLISASNWSEMKRSRDQDVTFLAELSFGAPVPWSLHDRSRGELFTQEVRLQSRDDGPFQWLVGLYYLEQDADFSQFVPDYSCPTCLSEVLAGQDFALDSPLARFSEEEQRSVFMTASYELTSAWTIGAGLRYLEDELTSLESPADGFLVGGPTVPRDPLSTTVYELNPSAYVRYEPSENATVYAQAARGFRSGSVNQVTPDACAEESAARGIGPFTDPDTLWNYELGFKSQLAEGRVGLNAAVYRQEWQGVQLSTTLQCGFSNGINGGDVTSEGAELELVLRPGGGWRFDLAAALNQSEFESVVAGTGFARGERLPDVPEINGSAGAQYGFDLSSEWSGFVRADYVYVGDIRLKFGDEVLEQAAFGTANLRLTLERDALSVGLFGRNVTDKRAIVTTGQPAFGSKQTLIRPRELGVELRYAFR